MPLSCNTSLALIISVGIIGCSWVGTSSGTPGGGAAAASVDQEDATGGKSSSSKAAKLGGNTSKTSSATKGGSKNSSTSATSGGEESSGGSSQASTTSAAKAGSSGGGASSSSNKGGAAGASAKKSGTGGTSQGQGGTTMGGATTTAVATGGAQNVSVPRLSNGQDGWASRYWDCCKPSCGWTGNANGKTPVTSCDRDNNKLPNPDAKSACEGGPAYECWDLVPWSVGPNLAYGYAAFNGVPCGTCMQLDFTGGSHNGNAASTGPLSSKTMIVQVINIGGIGGGQFDLLIPGGGVGDFNACSTQWGSSDLGVQYGGFMLACNGDKGCVQNKCNTVFGSKPLLKAGCDWFLGWFNGADNPTLKYAQLATCPEAITAKSGMR